MTVLDARPEALDVKFRPGSVVTLNLNGPAGWLGTRAFTATLNGVGLSVAESGDTLVIVASSGVTGALSSPGTRYPLVIHMTGGNDAIVGSWTASENGSPATTVNALVLVDSLNVAVSILGSGTGGGGGGQVNSVVAGTNVTVDSTDPANPVVSATGGGSGAVSSVNTRTGAVTGLAEDNTVVHTTGGETVAGVKTFTSQPIVPDATTATAALNRETGDARYDATGAAAAAQAFAIQRANHTGSQAESTVTNLVSDLAAKAADSSVVHVTGAETVAGVKNFTSTPLVPGASLAADQAAGTASPRTLGTGAAQAAAGNDTRLSDSRTPTAHHTTHESGGSDQVTLAESQITGLVADLAAKAPLASPVFTGNPTGPTPSPGDNDLSLATTAFVTDAVTTGVAGLMDYRGAFDASANLFPATGGSGIAGAVLKADFWVCSIAGTLGSKAVSPGDLIAALVDTPGQTAGNWDLIEHDLGYAPADSAVTLTAGTGLTGGGNLTTSRTFNVVANADGTMIANADDIQVGTLVSGNVPNSLITNAMHANMAQATFKMRAAAAGTGAPIDGTATQAKTALAIANTDVSGLGTLSTQSGTFSGTSSGTNTGDQTITLTGDVTGTGTGSFASTIAAHAVTNAKSAQMVAHTYKGNNTGSTADPIDVTLAQLKTELTLSGSNTGDQTITLTGDGTGSGTGSFALTLATVNSNVGSFGDASHVTALTVNGKGLVTAAASTAITIPESAVTNLTTDLAALAPQASPTFTGTVTVPAPAAVGSAARLQDTYTEVGINAQTGTTYTLVLADAGKLVTLSNASAIALSIPTNASVAFPVGARIDIAQIGAGQVTTAATTPGTTTVTSTGGTVAQPKCRAQYSGATLIKTATDAWLVVGDLA